MVSEATIEAYKAMTNEQGCASMKEQIQENLERTCDKFAGNEDKLDRCISYLEDCASEILEGKSDDVPDEVCFRICRDYFNDEIWKNGSVNQFYGDESARDIKVMRPGPKVQECLNSWLDKYKADVTKALKGTA